MEEKVWVVRLSIGAPRKIIKLYALYIMNEEDRPMTHNGKIVFSKSLKKIKACAPLFCPNITDIVQDNGFEINPADAIDVLVHQNDDYNCVNLNCLNTYIDFIKKTGVKIDVKIHKKINRFLDHVTFHHNISVFFQKNPDITVTEIISFINWGTGVILNNSVIH